MRKVWDIIDSLSPSIEVTQHTETRTNLATPGKKFTFSVAAGLVLATASCFCFSVPQVNAPWGMHKKAPVSAVAAARSTKSAPDTTVAMSGRKLAAAFSAHFQPADEEADYQGEYFFD
jgi:hypothetical protein